MTDLLSIDELETMPTPPDHVVEGMFLKLVQKAMVNDVDGELFEYKEELMNFDWFLTFVEEKLIKTDLLLTMTSAEWDFVHEHFLPLRFSEIVYAYEPAGFSRRGMVDAMRSAQAIADTIMQWFKEDTMVLTFKRMGLVWNHLDRFFEEDTLDAIVAKVKATSATRATEHLLNTYSWFFESVVDMAELETAGAAHASSASSSTTPPSSPKRSREDETNNDEQDVKRHKSL